MRGGVFSDAPVDPLASLTEKETTVSDGSRYTETRLRAGGRVLTSRSRLEADVNTVWTEEHFLKDIEDLKACLDLPAPVFGGRVDQSGVLATEELLNAGN